MDVEVGRIEKKYKSNEFPLFVRSLVLDGLRGFKDCRIEFNFPIVAIVGENGAGKSTVLKALACAYDNQALQPFFPGRFFMNTPWDKVSGVRLEYGLKHGNQERYFTIRKPTSRWRGTQNRPRRFVFLADISRTMPVEALAGYAQMTKRTLVEAGSEELPDDLRKRLSFMLARDYKEARFAHSSWDPEKRIGILGQNFGSYSQFHQGAGESSSLSLLGLLKAVPEHSLVLMDEAEASLHPKAQRRLISILLWMCRIKCLQVVITTHSPYILEELPDEARVLLLVGENGPKVVYGASTEFCLSSIDDREHPELSIFVEDRQSLKIVREILAKQDPDLLRRCGIFPVGPANVVANLGSLADGGKLPYRAIAFQDPDQDDSGCLVLPGQLSPERQVFGDLRAKNWPQVHERLGQRPSEIRSILEKAMLIPDHHRWCIYVGDRTNTSSNEVWDTLAGIWVRECLSNDASDDIVQAIKDRLTSAESRSLN